MIEKKEFLIKYNITEGDFLKTNLKWENLESIFEDYEIYKIELEPTAVFIFNNLMKAQNVHSVRYRIKDSEHLIEKIIRRKLLNETSNITIENYKTEVTDLIGVRALHLFKEEWININDFIISCWELKQKPTANFRNGDSKKITDFYSENDCDLKEHKYGYRSVHYIIQSQPLKDLHFAEIQVRTIFEEAWAEIDHTIRYPYDLDNEVFSQYLLILNRLSGSADEMGTFIQFLKSHLIQKDEEFESQLNEKNLTISKLEVEIEKFGLKEEQLVNIKIELEKLKAENREGFIKSTLGPQSSYNRRLNRILNLKEFTELGNNFKNIELNKNPKGLKLGN